MKFPVKKTFLTLLAALGLICPAAGMAQELPAFDMAKPQTAEQAWALAEPQTPAMDDLTLALETDLPRLEPGQSVTLRLTAGNPMPQEVAVTLTLKLPGRVACDGETVWQATLPAAKTNAETGALEPGVATFERALTLADDGASEGVTLEAEMGMGTRFYRASAPLSLCLPDVSVNASVEGAADGRIEPGAAFAYGVTIENAGAAAKAMRLELILPDGVEAVGAMPMGFALDGASISGDVVAVAADGDGEASRMTLTFPVRARDDVLDGDEDASKLLSGILRVDGERVPLGRVQVCGPLVSAKLLSDAKSVEAGEALTLRVVVVNSGMAGADVRVRCALPEGLSLRTKGAAQDDEAVSDAGDGEAQAASTQDEAEEIAALPADGGENGPDAAVAADIGGELVYDLHMEPAAEREGGIVASTRVIEIPVVAAEAMEQVDERLLGATLAWSVGGGEAQLGEAVALRVYRPQFLGMGMEQWMGVAWAALLMTATVVALYFALRGKNEQDDYAVE